MTHLHWLFFAIPVLSMTSILTGFFHLRRLRPETDALHESVDAITSYLRDSTRVFLQRHLILVGMTVGILVAGSVVLSIVGLHVAMLPALIVWGVVWSSIIGYFAIRKSTQLSGDLLQQAIQSPDLCVQNSSRLGWAFTLIPLGILTLLLSYWLAIFHLIVRFNVFGAGARLMHRAGLNGAWTEATRSHIGFQNMAQSEAGVILLAFCFGIMIQTYLVKFTTQLMRHTTGEASSRINLAHPEVNADDLRNPLSLACHLSQYADEIWGQLSRMMNTCLTVVLAATAILLAAVRENPLLYDLGTIRLPFIITIFGLLALCVVSLLSLRTRSRQTACAAIVIGGLTALTTVFGLTSWTVFIQVGLTLAFVMALAFVQTQKERVASLSQVMVTVTLTGIWGVGLFLCADVHPTLLNALAGISVGAVTLMSVTLPDVASDLKANLLRLTQSNARILQIDLSGMDDRPPAKLPYSVIISTCSLIFLFFTFFNLVPYWLTTIHHPQIASKMSQIGDKHASLYHIGDIERLIHISPTDGLFLIGILTSIWIILGMGAYVQRTQTNIELRLFHDADSQLVNGEAIMQGLRLPEYHRGVQSVTTDAFKTSFFVATAVWFVTLLIWVVLGVSGVIGLFVGLIVCSVIGGIYTWIVPKELADGATRGYFLVSLVTQAMLLFASLFGVVVLSCGMGF